MASEFEIARGTFHPPGSNAALDASLWAEGSRLRVRLADTGAVQAVENLGSFEISNRIGRIPRRIFFSSGSLFETANNDAIDAWLNSRNANTTGWITEIERFHPRLAVFVILVAVFVGGIYRYGLPALIEVAVWATPPVVNETLASSTLTSLDQVVFAPSKLPQPRQLQIRDEFMKLTQFSERGSFAYKLNFRDGGYIGPNAFALPDGNLVITDQLIEMAAGDDEMIMGVLAHEIGHVEKDHALRQLYRAAGVAGLITLIAGDVGSAGEDILSSGAGVLSLSYTRDAESEADRVSVELMLKAGHDPTAIGRFFKILEDKLGDHGDTSMLSTHPGTPERRKAVDDYAKLLKEKMDRQ